MERNKKTFRRVIAVLLAVMMLVSLSAVCFGASAAKVTKKQKTYDIAVVFDNSGSMYMNGNKAWCQAKYAMEIFASMLSYENGDQLRIYPMWKVVTDGSQPGKEGFTDEQSADVQPIDIKSKENISLISNMFTISPTNTPFEPVRDAYAYLKGSKKTEKWLVVLTDGAFDQDKRNQKASINLQGELSAMASSDIKVQYLGIGDASSLRANPEKNLYAKNSNAQNLQSDLSEICNRIFRRSVLDSKYLKGQSLTLDMSMNSLIVFAQGSDENVRINSLKDKNGNTVNMTLNSEVRKFSEISSNSQSWWDSGSKVDTSLYGQVVTFAGCPKGEYTLDYSGAKNIQIFYEPDVDILVSLKNKENNEEVYNSSMATDKNEISAGEYILDYKVVDNVTGDDVTNSALLGKIDLSAEIVPSEGEAYKIKKGGDVKINVDESTYIKVSGTYLEDYTITTDDNKAAFSLKVKLPEVDKLEMNIEGADNWYTIKDHEKWQPMKVSFTLNGQPLTEAQMKQLEFTVAPSKPSLAVKAEKLKGESACAVAIARDKDGNFVQPETGVYTLEFSAKLPDDGYGQRPGDTQTKLFEIQKYAEYWRWLIYVIIFAVIITLFCIFMSQKVLPKKLRKESMRFYMMGREIGGGTFRYDRKGKKIDIKSDAVPNKPDAECRATFTLKAVDRRWVPSRNRQIGITNITSSTIGVNKIVVDGVVFVKKDGKFVMNSSPNDPIDEKTKDPSVKIETRYSYLDCTTTQSK